MGNFKGIILNLTPTPLLPQKLQRLLHCGKDDIARRRFILKVAEAEIFLVALSSSTKEPTESLQATLREMRYQTIIRLKNQIQKFVK